MGRITALFAVFAVVLATLLPLHAASQLGDARSAAHEAAMKKVQELGAEGRKRATLGKVDEDIVKQLLAMGKEASTRGDDETAQKAISEAGEIYSTAFEFSQANMPCPPSKADVEKLAKYAKAEADCSNGSAEANESASRHFEQVTTALEQHLRDFAQHATTKADRDYIIDQAKGAVLNGLLDELATGGPIQKPNCKDDGDWRGMIVYRHHEKSDTNDKGTPAVVPGVTTEKDTHVDSVYVATIRLYPTGKARAKVVAEEHVFGTDRATMQMDCSAGGKGTGVRNVEMRDSNDIKSKAALSTDAKIDLTVEDAKYSIQVEIPPIAGKTLRTSHHETKGACGHDESTNNANNEAWEAPEVVFELEGDLLDPNHIAGEQILDKDTRIQFQLSKPDRKPRP